MDGNGKSREASLSTGHLPISISITIIVSSSVVLLVNLENLSEEIRTPALSALPNVHYSVCEAGADK